MSLYSVQLFSILFLSYNASAQAGINTTNPDVSSMLDISATDKGLLIPRISIPNLALAAPVSAPVTSLLVFNTNVTTGIGYYYWNGSSLAALSTGINWGLTGNAGTTTATNFIGKTDAQDLVVKTNNTEAARVKSDGNIGIGINNPSTKLHLESTSSPALRLVDGTQAAGRYLISDANGNATWQPSGLPNIISFQNMVIPVCNNVAVNTTGSFNIPINGINTNVSWRVLVKTPATLFAPFFAEKLQVKYDFSPILPINPLGIIFTGLNNSGYPDTFSLNYKPHHNRV